MPEGLEAQQVRAIFFPKRKQFTFHRINMEYLVPLKSMRRDSVYTLLDAGLRNNLRNVGGTDDVLCSLRPQLEGLASWVSAQGTRLVREREQLRGQLFEQARHGFHAYRAEVEVDFANIKLVESFASKQATGFEQVLTAEHMLRDALGVNPQNYRAHFELGWIYLSLLERLPEAEFHLECASRLALKQGDIGFAAFARRHLADACYSQHNYSAALENCLQVLHTPGLVDDMESLYECTRYMAAQGEVGLATQRLAVLVARSPVYYVLAQVEPDFTAHEGIRGMLHDLRQGRVNRISHYVHVTWQNHPLARMPLPDRIDPNRLFQQTFHQHVRVMSHLPYVTLTQRENQIADLILDASAKRIVKEIRHRSRQYEQASEKKRQRWSWVNKTGGFFLHSAVVLLLGCVMFFAARYVADMLGMGVLLSANDVVTHVFFLLLVLLLVGIALVGFIPLGVRKLLRKQVELDNTLKLIHWENSFDISRNPP